MRIIAAGEIDFDRLEALEVVWDTENNKLLNESSIDYTKIPYRLRDSFKYHCWVAIDYNSEDVYTFVQEEIKTHFPLFAKKVKRWIGANSINYDHLVAKLVLGLDYTIGPDSVGGKPCVIDDTLVLSKTLNPDRPAHSLEYAGQVLGFHKIDWRAKAIELGLILPDAPAGAEFEEYHPEMLNYCIRDCQVTKAWHKHLMQEWGDWNWDDAYQLEKAVAEIITRQEHRGFKFDTELAKSNLEELDRMMEEIRVRVEPSLPPKKATKKLMGEYTPPKNQFKKNGEASANLIKFAAKIGGEVLGDPDNGYTLSFNGETYNLPLAQEPLVTEAPMTLADSTQIKEYLVKDFNWVPTSYKERDLTVDTKKHKLTKEKFKAAVERYIEQTLESAFCQDRCDHLGVKPQQLREKLLSHDMKRPLKVLTNPSFTVGQEKELCSGLVRIAESYPHAQDIAHWLTYRHRRNSILGGGVDFDDDEAEKGFLSFVREDGRIPTPADTCGATSRRFLHRVVANIPRVSSLYGHNMRAMFGVDKDAYLIGADFISLEAMEEAHYTYKYPGGREYGESLTKEKPNSIHCVNSRKMGVSRDEAKTVKYLLGYGGQIPKLAKSTGWSISRSTQVYNGFWEAAKPLKLLIENLTKYWETVGNKEFILGIDGSKIRTRSRHSLLNNLLQSAGAICAKKQMVLFDRKVQAAGLQVDFFKDDWTKNSYAQQLIQMHDENQVECSKDLVKFKKFSTAAEAEKYMSQNKYAGGIIKNDKGIFVPESIVGQMLQEAAQETSQELNMKVTLGMDWAVGKTWAGTH